MRSRLTVFIIFAVSAVFVLLFARQAYLSKDLPRDQYLTPTLRVLTYRTFMTSNGPGKEIFKRFKAEQHCEIEIQTVEDAGLLSERLHLAGAQSFDVVIGLDQFNLTQARAVSDWTPMDVPRQGWAEPIADLKQDTFIPYDWSPLTFVYRKAGDFTPPQSLVQLLDPRFKHQIGLQDPHNSSPGRQFLNWVVAFNHDQTGDFLRRLQPNVQSVSPSWAFSYGLFEKRQVRLVFSYLTSLAYHWGMDHDRGFQVTQFAEGHPLQVEFVGVPKSCRQCRLGQLLASTLLEPWAQKLIMERNFMRPVLQSAEQNTVFAELPKLKTLRLEDSTQKYLREWDEIFKH